MSGNDWFRFTALLVSIVGFSAACSGQLTNRNLRGTKWKTECLSEPLSTHATFPVGAADSLSLKREYVLEFSDSKMFLKQFIYKDDICQEEQESMIGEYEFFLGDMLYELRLKQDHEQGEDKELSEKYYPVQALELQTRSLTYHDPLGVFKACPSLANMDANKNEFDILSSSLRLELASPEECLPAFQGIDQMFELHYKSRVISNKIKDENSKKNSNKEEQPIEVEWLGPSRLPNVETSPEIKFHGGLAKVLDKNKNNLMYLSDRFSVVSGERSLTLSRPFFQLNK